MRPWYSRVDDKLIIGALPWLSIQDELIEKEHVKGVVSMNEDFELKLLKNWVTNPEDWNNKGVQFLQLHTQDIFEVPTQDKLVTGVNFIMPIVEDIKDTNASVYVHCKAGRTRSATLVACYLMKRYNWTPEQAFEHLVSKRPQLALHSPQWQAIREFYHKHVNISGTKFIDDQLCSKNL